MIKITNNTESLGLYQGDIYKSEKEMRSLVSDWLLEGGMENEAEREAYIARWMEEVSFEEIPEGEGNNEKMIRLGCEPWDQEDPEDEGYRTCPECEGHIYDPEEDDEPCPECGGEGLLQWQIEGRYGNYVVIIENVSFGENFFVRGTIYEEKEETKNGWFVAGPIKWQVGEINGNDYESRYLPGNAIKEVFEDIKEAIAFAKTLD